VIRSALRLYGDGLASNGELTLRLSDGTAAPLALARWLGPPDDIDRRLLRGARGPVLDVGCGPGRHLHALARTGVFALGIDLSPVAVELARTRGATAIVRSIFEEIPGAGTWRTALLLDGNIGIGGDPVRLLSRVRTLLRSDGEALVELDPPHITTEKITARLEGLGEASGWFRWARVATADIGPSATAAGFAIRRTWPDGGRWFARLQVAQ
jgi:SAM-dependent methyltransferase